MSCTCTNVVEKKKNENGNTIRRISSKKGQRKESKYILKMPRTSNIDISPSKCTLIQRANEIKRKDAYGKEINKESKKYKVTFIDQIDKSKPLVEVIGDNNKVIREKHDVLKKYNNAHVDCQVCIIF